MVDIFIWPKKAEVCCLFFDILFEASCLIYVFSLLKVEEVRVQGIYFYFYVLQLPGGVTVRVNFCWLGMVKLLKLGFLISFVFFGRTASVCECGGERERVCRCKAAVRA